MPTSASTTAADEQTDVLIVGGGLAGLSAALFLARSGVRPVLVERHPGTAVLPQARAFNPRSMEIYRSLGLEPTIRNHTSPLADYPEMIGADTLSGGERFRVDLLAQVRPPTGVSPTDWCMIDQDELERVLRAAAESAGTGIRFGVELTDLAVEDDSVAATIRDGDGAEHRIQANYLLACDGHRGGIRRRLGIDIDGPGVLMDVVYFMFEADLTRQVGDRRFLLAYLDKPRTGTALVPARTPDHWSVGVPFEPGRAPTQLTPAECADLARQAVGDADLPMSLIPPVPGWPDLLSRSTVGASVATHFHRGRVFLVGDAAHVVPPAGSFGANTAIADAHNIAWKLAAVLHGWAGSELLDTYDLERRPVATLTMQAATQMMQQRHTADSNVVEHLDEISMIFGYSYDPQVATLADPRTPTGDPGLRAPHVWIDGNRHERSTLDLLGDGFTVLTGSRGSGWAQNAADIGAALDVPLRTLVVGRDLADPDGHVARAYGITDSGASLIRPDGFVAWRITDPITDGDTRFERALRTALRRNH